MLGWFQTFGHKDDGRLHWNMRLAPCKICFMRIATEDSITALRRRRPVRSQGKFVCRATGGDSPGLGGSAERNISRWYGQFKEPKEAHDVAAETRKSSGHRIYNFRTTGTLMGREGDTFGYALHAALLDGPLNRVFVCFADRNANACMNAAAFRKLTNGAFGG